MDPDRELGELRVRVDAIGDRLTEVRDDMRAGFGRLEVALTTGMGQTYRRISTLERWRSWLTGAIGATGLGTLWEMFRR